MRKLILFFLMLMLFCYSAKAESVTAAAVFNVENTLPIVKLGLYEDDEFRKIRGGFLNGEQGYLRIEIDDGNSYRDINYVGIKLFRLENGSNIDVEGYKNYINATFLTGGNDRAIYYHIFIVPNEGENFRLQVMVKDGEEEIFSTIEFNNNLGSQVTGAAIARPERRQVIEFFSNIWRKLLDLF